jgi:multidrug efflux pump subunit AcrB
MQVFGNLGVNSYVFSPPPLPGAGGGAPVQLVISTVADYRSLVRIAQQVMAQARATGRFAYLDVDLKFANPTVRVTVKRDKAALYGITMKDIGDTLATMMAGGYVGRINIDGRGYKVIPQAPREERLTPEDIGRFYVISATDPDKIPIPLSELVELQIDVNPTALLQHNQLNSATISAIVLPGQSIGDAVSALREITARELPAGFGIDWKGESRQFVTEGSSLVTTFVLAICIIFLVLAAQFESFRDPLVIMLSVPLALSGALLPMALGVVSLNIYSQVGLITLVGLITKHGILICEVAKEVQEKEGRNRTEAVMEAARQRLRPILMTTAAMVAGLVPLLFASGAGAASRHAIGVVIVAGLAIGTLFTLFVLPVVYTFMASIHRPQAADEDAPEHA